jgi:AcrR family transcriptional regulator
MPTDAQRRITEAARRCFAARGFAATTVADIEREAGFQPRTGGVYRHIGSKQAMLEAVIAAELAANAEAIVETPDPPPGADLRDVLTDVARRGLDQLDRQAELMRILFRDLDRFPDLLAQVRTHLTDATYRDLADRFDAAQAAGLLPPMDVEAVTVIAIGAVVDFKVKQHLLGFVPLDLPEDRLVAAWVDLLATYLERTHP